MLLLRRLRRAAHRQEPRVQYLDVPCPASLFFSARARKLQERVGRGHRYVPASAVPCIPRARPQPARAPSASVPDFRLPVRFVPAAAPVLRRAAPASVMFRVA